MWPFPHPPIPRLFPGVASDTVREASGEALGPGRSSTSKHHISWDRAIWLLLHYESPWYSLFQPNQHIWGAVGGTVFETSLVDTSSEQQGWPSNIKCRQMSISLAVTCLFNFLLGSLCVDGFCNCFGLRFYKVPKYLEVMPEEYLHDSTWDTETSSWLLLDYLLGWDLSCRPGLQEPHLSNHLLRYLHTAR